MVSNFRGNMDNVRSVDVVQSNGDWSMKLVVEVEEDVAM
jgi:hypothetical protein